MLKNGYLVDVISIEDPELYKFAEYKVSIAGYETTKNKEISCTIMSPLVLSTDLESFKNGIKYFLDNCELKKWDKHFKREYLKYNENLWTIRNDKTTWGTFDVYNSIDYLNNKKYELKISLKLNGQHASIFVNKKVLYDWSIFQYKDVKVANKILGDEQFSKTINLYPYRIKLRFDFLGEREWVWQKENKMFNFKCLFNIDNLVYDYTKYNVNDIISLLKQYDN